MECFSIFHSVAFFFPLSPYVFPSDKPINRVIQFMYLYVLLSFRSTVHIGLACTYETFDFSAWFTYLNMMLSSSHQFTCKQHNFIFLYGWITLHCVYKSHFLNQFISCGDLGCFQSLIILNSAAKYISVQVALLYPGAHSFSHMPRSGIAGSYGSFVFSFLRNLHTDFHSGCTNLCSHWQFNKCPFPQHGHQHLLMLLLLIAIDWSEVESQCHFDLHSFMAKDAEHFFIYLLAICTSFENCPFSSFIPLFSGPLILFRIKFLRYLEIILIKYFAKYLPGSLWPINISYFYYFSLIIPTYVIFWPSKLSHI
jgi:hypothetical protein